MPKISAIMALYNTPYDYLKTTVESILNQTSTDFELIVIDDASSMEYKGFFEQFKDTRIKYFKLEQNAGPGHARNEGIKKAKGEYIAIVDSDDVYMPRRFELQSEFFNKNPDISLCGCNFRFSNRKKLSNIVLNDKSIKAFMLFNSPFSNSTMMFRRKEFAQKNLFYVEDINFGEDYALWIYAMISGIKMANLEDFLMIYTRRPGQLSREKQEKQIAILMKLYQKIFNYIGFEATQEELVLHYSIYSESFEKIESSEKISNWFDKIIEHNTEIKMFDEGTLLDRKNQVLEQYDNAKNRLFKIKIGGYNLCLSKKMNIYLQERN